MRGPVVLVATLLLGGVLGFKQEFSEFKKTFGKVYTRQEENERFSIFKSNLERINNHNADPNRKWSMKVTQFTDLTSEEYIATLKGYRRMPMSGQTIKESKVSSTDWPATKDWRDVGVVTEPKNQQSCGSCWAFATAEQIESYAALSNISVPELSTQEITSCTPNPLHCGGTGGCMGSIPQLGYSYVQLFGLTTEEEYPYWSGITTITGRCKYDIDRRTPVVSITGYNTIPANDLEATLHHVGNVGPLAVAADASAWQFYGSGVFDSCNYANNIALNHAVQLVGYGTDENEGDYWIVRNSWGKNWGDHGYIRLKRESELECGVDSTPMTGTACEDGPGTDEQTVCGMCGVLFDSSYPLGAHAFHA